MCQYGCNLASDDRVTGIDHDLWSGCGRAHYFCAVHQVFHAVLHRCPTPQPLCGDCAVNFYHHVPTFRWQTGDDIDALPLNEEVFTTIANTRMEAYECGQYRYNAVQLADFEKDKVINLPIRLAAKVPHFDPTFDALEESFIYKRSVPGIKLLKFMTPQGDAAYQPCAHNFNGDRYFEDLSKMEKFRDPILKKIRDWSCQTQAIDALPKKLRWLLATVYHLPCLGLRSSSATMRLSELRKWLFRWCEVAREFLVFLRIPLRPPHPAWSYHSPRLPGLSTLNGAGTRQTADPYLCSPVGPGTWEGPDHVIKSSYMPMFVGSAITSTGTVSPLMEGLNPMKGGSPQPPSRFPNSLNDNLPANSGAPERSFSETGSGGHTGSATQGNNRHSAPAIYGRTPMQYGGSRGSRTTW